MLEVKLIQLSKSGRDIHVDANAIQDRQMDLHISRWFHLKRKQNYIHISIHSQHLDDAGSYNPSLRNTRTYYPA